MHGTGQSHKFPSTLFSGSALPGDEARCQSAGQWFPTNGYGEFPRNWPKLCLMACRGWDTENFPCLGSFVIRLSLERPSFISIELNGLELSSMCSLLPKIHPEHHISVRCPI